MFTQGFFSTITPYSITQTKPHTVVSGRPQSHKTYAFHVYSSVDSFGILDFTAHWTAALECTGFESRYKERKENLGNHPSTTNIFLL